MMMVVNYALLVSPAAYDEIPEQNAAQEKKNKGRSELPNCRFLRDISQNTQQQLPGTFHNVKTFDEYEHIRNY